MLRRGMVVMIGSAGHEVTSAATIADGIEQLAAGPSHLLLDMNLPDGKGTTMLRHVRTKDLPVRVAVRSGSGDAALMAEPPSLKPGREVQEAARLGCPDEVDRRLTVEINSPSEKPEADATIRQ